MWHHLFGICIIGPYAFPNDNSQGLFLITEQLSMRKIYLIIAFAALALKVSAFTKLLVGYQSTDNIETCQYVWDTDNVLTEMRYHDARTPDMDYIVTITYDELGREIRNDMYQDMNESGTDDYDDFIPVAYVDLSYDNQGRVCERVNYNNWEASYGRVVWTLGGVITYEYDAQGRKSSEKIYFALDKKDLFMDTRFSYDDAGRLVSREDWLYTYGGESRLNARLTYLYSDGKLMRIQEEAYNMETNEMETEGYTRYRWTSAGSLAAIEYQSATTKIQEAKYFQYPPNPLPASDIKFPYEFDNPVENEIYGYMTEAPELYELHRADMNSGVVDMVASYIYEYRDADTGGLAPTWLDAATPVFSRDGETLRIQGLTPDAKITIMTADGKTVTQCRYGTSVDLSSLAAGLYLVATPSGAFKIIK